MSATAKVRLRRIAAWVAAALTMLGWATVAAAGRAASAPDGPRTQGPGVAPQELLAKLPEKWEQPELLIHASVEINALLAKADQEHRIVPWPLAEGIRRSLQTGRSLAGRIGPETRPAYLQSLCMAALAAGYPSDALGAARELTGLDGKSGWNWLATYRAGMLCGDKAACTEAVDHIARMVPPDRVRALDPIRQQAEPIGEVPEFSMRMADGTILGPATLRGKVAVFDFWAQADKAYRDGFPRVREVQETFRGYEAFLMVGVNMDTLEFRSVVAQYMRANGITWPQYFEGHGDRPVSFKVFKSRRMPSQAVLSPTSKVIFLGQPDDPLLYYAIRAGLVEAAKGNVPASQPAGPEVSKRTGLPVTAPVVPKLPVNAPTPPDVGSKAEREKLAQQQLRIGEAFEAADSRPNAVRVYKEILSNYPDTDAATKARTRLMVLEP